MKTIFAKDAGIGAAAPRLSAQRIRRLLESVSEDTTVCFESCQYTVDSDGAFTQMMYIPNHDEDTEKQAAFVLRHQNHVTLDFGGSLLVFEGEIIPFYLERCANVEIRNVRIDYRRPSFSQGVIKQVSAREMMLAIDPARYPWFVRDGRLFFHGGGFDEPLALWLEMDAMTGAPVYDTHDQYVEGDYEPFPLCAEALDKSHVRLRATSERDFLPSSRVGNTIILRHHPRSHPGFYCDHCREITLRDVTLHSTMGIGFLAEATENIKLERMRVVPNLANPRAFTCAADATHFVHCSGHITLEDCFFEKQLDDALNVHGIYGRIVRKLDAHTLLFELVHPMQLGVYLGESGEHLSLVDAQTMLGKATMTIHHLTRLSPSLFELQTKDTLPDGLSAGDVLENMDRKADVTVTGCTFRKNRARGILLTCRSAMVSHCVFQSAGAAVLLEGDAAGWFESGATQSITLEDNLFDACAYVSDWGRAPIQVTPTVKAEHGEQRFHQQLIVRHNRFRLIDPRLVYARHLHTLLWQHNVIEPTNEYPPLFPDAPAFDLQGVVHQEVQL